MNASATINKIFEFLQLVKYFEPAYSTDTFQAGYMLIEYGGKRYALKLTETLESETPEMSVWNEAERNTARNLFLILQLAKAFTVRYSWNTIQEGCLLIEHEGVSYNLKLSEIKYPSENIFDDILRLKYLV